MRGLYEVFYAGHIFLRLVTWAIVIWCVLSWFRPAFRAYEVLGNLIRPFVAPFRALSEWLMRYMRAPLDFTCFFAVIGWQLVDRLWWRLYFLLARAF